MAASAKDDNDPNPRIAYMVLKTEAEKAQVKDKAAQALAKRKGKKTKSGGSKVEAKKARKDAGKAHLKYVTLLSKSATMKVKAKKMLALRALKAVKK